MWTLSALPDLEAELSIAHLPASALTLDGERLQALDTAGALALLMQIATSGSSIGRTVNLKPEHASVIDLVRSKIELQRPWSSETRRGFVVRLGAAAARFSALVVVHPRRAGWKELAAQLQHVCIEAIPMVTLVAFLIDCSRGGFAGARR